MKTRHNLSAYEEAGLEWVHLPVEEEDDGRRSGAAGAAAQAAAGGCGRHPREPPHRLRREPCARRTWATGTGVPVEESLAQRGRGRLQPVPLTSASRLSATATGLRVAGSGGLLGRRLAGQDERGVEPRALRRLDVGVDPVADDERPALAEPLERGQEELRLRLADDRGLAAARRLDGREQRRPCRARARPASDRSGRGSWRGSPPRGGAPARPCGCRRSRPARCRRRPRGRRGSRGRCCSSP